MLNNGTKFFTANLNFFGMPFTVPQGGLDLLRNPGTVPFQPIFEISWGSTIPHNQAIACDLIL
jgi:hypothetical protein